VEAVRISLIELRRRFHSFGVGRDGKSISARFRNLHSDPSHDSKLRPPFQSPADITYIILSTFRPFLTI